ncbi:MAG: lytic murein transglycosylase [Candidatus Marinimicrobia bacterium]|nr:lytic murein transglycosylase [Candidatus Neomarinimicrobiota bacterium]
MKWLTIIYLISIYVYATDSSSTTVADPVYNEIKLKAIEKGLPESFIQNTFSNESIEIHPVIPERFARPYEKKTWDEYKKLFVTQRRINSGKEFYNKTRQDLEAVANYFGVDPFLILSIIGVESNYGSHHKEFTVFNSLYTQIAVMPKRARWAKTEMVEFLSYCYKDSVPPHSVFGSYAGAFGYGQFIPSSFNNFAIDFDEDGVRQAYEWPDVMASIANYLLKNGYPKNDYSNSEKVYKSVYAYNHSDNYVKAVLALRDEIKIKVELEINSKG